MRIGHRARCRETAHIAPGLSMVLKTLQPLAAILHSSPSPPAQPIVPWFVELPLHLEPDMWLTSSNTIRAIQQCAICEQLLVIPSFQLLWEPATPLTLNSGTHKHT